MKPCPSRSFFGSRRPSYGVHDPFFAVTQLAQTSMRSEIGKMTLDRTVAMVACKDIPSSLFKRPHGLVQTSFLDVSGLARINYAFFACRELWLFHRTFEERDAMNQVRVLKPVGVLMVGVACAATCKVGVTRPHSIDALLVPKRGMVEISWKMVRRTVIDLPAKTATWVVLLIVYPNLCRCWEFVLHMLVMS